MLLARIVCRVSENHFEVEFAEHAYNLGKSKQGGMIHIGTIVGLQHQHAGRFFEEAMHPDLEELRKRDAFLARLEQKYPVRIEGGDLIATIPDVDVAAFLDEND